MTPKTYIHGREAYYDEKKKEWKYSDNHTSVNNKRPYSKCDEQPINDVDCYLYRIIAFISGLIIGVLLWQL